MSIIVSEYQKLEGVVPNFVRYNQKWEVQAAAVDTGSSCISALDVLETQKRYFYYVSEYQKFDANPLMQENCGGPRFLLACVN